MVILGVAQPDTVVCSGGCVWGTYTRTSGTVVFTDCDTVHCRQLVARVTTDALCGDHKEGSGCVLSALQDRGELTATPCRVRKLAATARRIQWTTDYDGFTFHGLGPVP